MEMEACVPVTAVRLTRSRNADGGLVVRLGVPLLDTFDFPNPDKAIAAKLQDSVARILLEPETRKLLLGQGLDAVGSTPEEFGKMVTDEMARWAEVAKIAHVKIE